MKKIKMIGVIALLVLTAFAFTGCDWFIAALATPYGSVLDAKTGAGIANATVKLSNSDGTYSITTSTTGTYDFASASEQPDYGDYALTVTKDGYAFTPLEVSISGLAQKFDTVVGVPSTSDGLLFVLMWDDGSTLDIDAYMTYPAPSVLPTSPIEADGVSTSYEAYVTDSSKYTNGFNPEAATATASDREGVYFGNTSSSASNEIVLDVDDQDGTGPETISVGWTSPWTAGDGTSFSPSLITDLNTTDTAPVVWAGTLEYYVDGYSDSLSTQGSYVGAHPVLYIFSGANCIGIYDVPDYTDIDTASLARIQVFNDATFKDETYFFAIYPDIRLLSSTTDIRNASTGEYEPLIVSRR
jgi:hypothetical protein